ncbi:alpha/beta hydrolase family protein [Aurantimonas endophytica]|uniref:Alpha/beta hydrolase n=1 Tax=Aurantimonas endophytica TaxID=1522175 RepID=A0A7W6HI52_9HYPH|nr:alpha/beta hydrolase [Aurantimonas endophytica]MBB4005371.1 hypothetical protein [Aurantimonas endophytica]
MTFPSQDGVPLEAWFIPCTGSDRLVIANHPMMFNRYGCPTHLEPWRSFGTASGNTFEVDYVADYRILHEAGYNVLTYDERNFGLSGIGNGGLNSGGRHQGRDVIGSLLYARGREDLKHMAIGLFSRCNGANANLYAIHTQPRHFDDVRCLLLCQPLSIRSIMTRELEQMGLADRVDQLEREIQLVASVTFDQMSPNLWARSVKTPAFVYQVHDDVLTTPADVQATFDAIPIAQKKLHWIQDTTLRWDGYLEFQRRPAPMLAWLDEYMA